ncbi:hypothetical protein EMIT079MI2_40275 [Bacillus sp. IT-79MI2]
MLCRYCQSLVQQPKQKNISGKHPNWVLLFLREFPFRTY